MNTNPYKGGLQPGDGHRARAWELGRLAGISECAEALRRGAEAQGKFSPRREGLLHAAESLEYLLAAEGSA